MATVAAPPNARTGSPLIRGSTYDRATGGGSVAYIVAVISSLLAHAILFALFFLLAAVFARAEVPTETVHNEAIVQPPPPEEPPSKDPLTVQDIDPAALDPDVDINFNNDNIAKVSVPGLVDLNKPIGIENGSLKEPPMNLPAPSGLGIGQGGALNLPNVEGNVNLEGMAGGYNLRGAALPGSFYGRSGATRKQALIEGGGTKATEAAVVKGLHWLLRVQHPDGAWRMEGPFRDPGNANNTAATAFGLLPFLGAGHTHRPGKDNPFDKPIERALLYLIRKQGRDGDLGGGMYGHALATIALCEAYGLTQDPALRIPAQRALNYLISAQHSGGGWRYSPGQAGDTSVTGWVIMALKSGKMANLDVPEMTFRKAIRFLDSVRNPSNEGYGYTGPGASFTLSAVGLLCRQYLQSWGPNNPRMIKGIENNIKRMPPGKTRSMYYYYYATQVMHHFGGQDWKEWNEKMRDNLVKRQDRDGSWNPRGDRHAKQGGRLMQTSLCLLTLEVYYRYLPLYYREAGERSQRLLMGSAP